MSGSSPRMRGAPPDLAVEVHGYGIIPAYAGSTLYRGSVLQRDRDHPRVCGEHVSATKPSVSALGSSPRMRGAQRAWLPVNHRVGIIPAYAGSTSPTRRRAAAARDHPRVCGEHITNQATCGSGQGSSPRMRGAPLALCGRREGDGIIPAYAGSTDGHGFVWAARRDHPRVCGEHAAAFSVSPPNEGSSPRMRGAPTARDAISGAHRIIPAYAGSTGRQGPASIRRRDHPRVCGEHTNNRTACKRRAGSSPRMRGALVCVLVHVSVVGIIPAYAGSTRNQSRGRTFYRDHPRVCGEHSAEHIAALAEQGSSPRMRGAPGPRRSSGKVTGIIPAYAGSTTKLFFRPSTCGDHPRVCGEHPTATVSECVERGSSPRMRGALLGELGGHVAARIIPAYAGSTRPPVRRWLRCGDHPRVCGEHSFSSFSQLSW